MFKRVIQFEFLKISLSVFGHFSRSTKKITAGIQNQNILYSWAAELILHKLSLFLLMISYIEKDDRAIFKIEVSSHLKDLSIIIYFLKVLISSRTFKHMKSLAQKFTAELRAKLGVT